MLRATLNPQTSEMKPVCSCPGAAELAGGMSCTAIPMGMGMTQLGPQSSHGPWVLPWSLCAAPAATCVCIWLLPLPNPRLPYLCPALQPRPRITENSEEPERPLGGPSVSSLCKRPHLFSMPLSMGEGGTQLQHWTDTREPCWAGHSRLSVSKVTARGEDKARYAGGTWGRGYAQRQSEERDLGQWALQQQGARAPGSKGSQC